MMLTTVRAPMTVALPGGFEAKTTRSFRREVARRAVVGWNTATRTRTGSAGTLTSATPTVPGDWGFDRTVGGEQASPRVRGESPVAELRRLSGLSGSQLARLLGVSRRSVQAWVAGAPMSPSHAERVHDVLMVVKSIGGSPEERRDALFDSSKGTSLFRGWEQQNDRLAPLHPAPYSPSDFLGS